MLCNVFPDFWLRLPALVHAQDPPQRPQNFQGLVVGIPRPPFRIVPQKRNIVLSGVLFVLLMLYISLINEDGSKITLFNAIDLFNVDGGLLTVFV